VTLSRSFLLRAVVVLSLASAVRTQAAGRQAGSAAAPALPPQPLTLDAAIEFAASHYPSLRALQAQVQAADAGVTVARTAYLPRLEALWQSNRGTANNVVGQVLPQAIIPALSGPVLPLASSESVWGSATGAFLSWEAFDFGLRNASVASAQAGLTRARAAESLTRLDVEAAVATAFLALVSAERAVEAARADLERRTVLVRAVHTLVDNQLRPGAEASRGDAERAAAETRLIQSQQTATIARLLLARALGADAGGLTIEASGLLVRDPSADVAPAAAVAHPLTQLRQATIDEANAQATVLLRTDRPRLFLQGSVSARGSGAEAAGSLDGSLRGLGLDRVNWAAGVQVQFPNAFDFSSLRARRRAAQATVRAERARYDEALLAVEGQQAIAAAMVAAARAIAANSPVQLAAARQSEAQARARYDAGLSDLVAVAEAQNLLAQAEVQDQLARVDVWRALLAEAVARGDVAPFVDLVRRTAGGR
jgi:outer membrane protein